MDPFNKLGWCYCWLLLYVEENIVFRLCCWFSTIIAVGLGVMLLVLVTDIVQLLSFNKLGWCYCWLLLCVEENWYLDIVSMGLGNASCVIRSNYYFKRALSVKAYQSFLYYMYVVFGGWGDGVSILTNSQMKHQNSVISKQTISDSVKENCCRASKKRGRKSRK